MKKISLCFKIYVSVSFYKFYSFRVSNNVVFMRTEYLFHYYYVLTSHQESRELHIIGLRF
jgi:hypothetical protein